MRDTPKTSSTDGLGHERRTDRRALTIRAIVSLAGFALVTVTLWLTKAESSDPTRNSIILGVALIVSAVSAFPFLLFLGALRTVRWSLYTGIGLLLATGLMLLSIVTSESSTASFGYLASVVFNLAILLVGYLLERRSGTRVV